MYIKRANHNYGQLVFIQMENGYLKATMNAGMMRQKEYIELLGSLEITDLLSGLC